MISFFRKIRKNLLNEGKTARYLKYALGEIVLVVIGILIALQINNWNEERKENNNEHEVIRSFYYEVVQNIEYTQDIKGKNQKYLLAVQELLNINNEELEVLSDEQLNNKFAESTQFITYSPIVNQLNNIISMKDLNLKGFSILINLLNQYKNSIHALNIQSDGILETFFNKQVPLFEKNISVKNVMHQRFPQQVTKSKNVVDIKKFITSLEFENLYADIYATSIATNKLINENLEIMQQIIKHIEEYNQASITNKDIR